MIIKKRYWVLYVWAESLTSDLPSFISELNIETGAWSCTLSESGALLFEKLNGPEGLLTRLTRFSWTRANLGLSGICVNIGQLDVEEQIKYSFYSAPSFRGE